MPTVPEDRLDELVSRFGISNRTDARYVCDNDPTRGTMLPWMLKQLARGCSPRDIVPTVSYFKENAPSFKSQNINDYNTLKELEDEVKGISNAKELKRSSAATARAGATIVYEDDRFKVLRITNIEASRKYGAGTRWCISMNDTTEFFDEYSNTSPIVFVIPRDRPDDKVAIVWEPQTDDLFAFDHGWIEPVERILVGRFGKGVPAPKEFVLSDEFRDKAIKEIEQFIRSGWLAWRAYTADDEELAHHIDDMGTWFNAHGGKPDDLEPALNQLIKDYMTERYSPEFIKETVEAMIAVEQNKWSEGRYVFFGDDEL